MVDCLLDMTPSATVCQHKQANTKVFYIYFDNKMMISIPSLGMSTGRLPRLGLTPHCLEDNLREVVKIDRCSNTRKLSSFLFLPDILLVISDSTLACVHSESVNPGRRSQGYGNASKYF